MSEYEIEEQNAAVSEAEMGSLRWRAIEASNGAPGLSPVARRVLSALICSMNGKTRECFPSELWLAEFLGIHLQSVKKAKAELRDKHKLIDWTNPGGPRHLSHYKFNWQLLLQISENGKSNARWAVTERRKTRLTSGSRTTTTEATSLGSHTATLESELEASMVAKFHSHGSQIPAHGSHIAIAVVAASLPDHPINNLPKRANLEHATFESEYNGLQYLDDAIPRLKQPEQRHQASLALAAMRPVEIRSVHSSKPFPYPKLLEAFDDLPEVRNQLLRMNAEDLNSISKTFAAKGKNAAAVLLKKAAA